MLVYAFYPLVETNGNEELKANNALIHCRPIYGTDKLKRPVGFSQIIAILTNLSTHNSPLGWIKNPPNTYGKNTNNGCRLSKIPITEKAMV
jgi:hypothetical protein